jgi:hypothetical protein
METPLKAASTGKVQYRITKGLGAIIRRVTAISPQSTLPYEMFANGLPYEALKTYRTLKSEFEHNQSTVMVEVHRQVSRGL